MTTTDKKTILVAGGAGFLGSHLCEKYLGDGHRVLCVDNLQTMRSTKNVDAFFKNPNFRFIEHDIIHPLRIDEPIDWIFQFAASGSPAIYQHDPVHTWKTCTLGSLNMLELAREKKARILFASTSEVYGDPSVTPQPETYTGNVHTIGPRACYDEGKRAAETLHFDYHRQYGVDAKIIRIFNTYGPRMNPNEGRAITDLIGDAVGGRSIKANRKEIVIYGDGSPRRSFNYVDDLIRGIDLMMQKEGFLGPVNLGNPHEISILELAEKIRELSASAATIRCENIHPTHDPMQRRPDITLAKRALGWEPRVSLEEGLEKTIAWFKTLEKPDQQVLVFATTFYPVLGPAERALFDLLERMPETEFHVITARLSKELPRFERLGNLFVYRIGVGMWFDKFLLAMWGNALALRLSKHKTFNFCWSIMASYGGVAAYFFARRQRDLTLLVTLDSDEFNSGSLVGRWVRQWVGKVLFSRADMIYASDPTQEEELKKRYPRLGAVSIKETSTDSFLEQTRNTYIALFNEKRGTLVRPQ